MADEVTTSAIDDLIYASIINDRIIDYARGSVVCPPLFAQKDISGMDSKAADFPKWGSLVAADIAEANDLANTALTTSKITITAAEVGVMVTVKDLANASAIVKGMDTYARQLGLAVADKIDTDCCALFTALNGGTAVGGTGVNMTDDNFMDAIYTLEAANAPKPYVAVLHPRQIADFRADLSANGAAFYGPNVGAGMVAGTNLIDKGNGFAGSFMGVEIYQTTHCPLVNSNADRSGAMFAKGEALGMVTKWPVRTELQRDASARATEVVVMSCYGVGEIMDTFGVPIETDA